MRDHLPYAADAMTLLRQAHAITWIGPEKGEQRVRPFFRDFDPDVQAVIDLFAARHGVSRSRVLTTALELRSRSPAVGAPPRGYKSPARNG